MTTLFKKAGFIMLESLDDAGKAHSLPLLHGHDPDAAIGRVIAFKDGVVTAFLDGNSLDHSIVRVKNYSEAKWFAYSRKLLKTQWVYIGNAYDARGKRPKKGVVYFVNYDVPYDHVEGRWSAYKEA
jgi:hypothetical protein